MTHSVSRLWKNHCVTTEEQSLRMLKMFRLLTHPTRARQDAPFRRQGRSSPTDLRFTFHISPFTALDDSMFQQIMQMHNPDNSLGLVRDDKRGDRKALHHFDRLGCQLIRSDQLGAA